MRIVVLGASGFIGLNVADALVARGHTPLCAHRLRTNVIPLRRRGLPMVVADIARGSSFLAALAGADVVVHAAGHYPRDSLNRIETLTRAHREMRHVLDTCALAHVRRLVYVSSTATIAPRPGGDRSDERDVYPCAPGLGTYHDAKWIMESMALDERRFEVTVVCPGACLGPWDLRVGTSSLLVAAAHGRIPPHPDGPISLVDVRDVGRAVAVLVEGATPPARVILAAHDARLHPFLETLALRYGTPPPPPPIDDAVAVAFADSEERRVAGTTERPQLHREIVDLVVNGVRLDARLGEGLAGGWTPLADTLDAYDAWARRLGIIPPRAPEAFRARTS